MQQNLPVHSSVLLLVATAGIVTMAFFLVSTGVIDSPVCGNIVSAMALSRCWWPLILTPALCATLCLKTTFQRRISTKCVSFLFNNKLQQWTKGLPNSLGTCWDALGRVHVYLFDLVVVTGGWFLRLPTGFCLTKTKAECFACCLCLKVRRGALHLLVNG